MSLLKSLVLVLSSKFYLVIFGLVAVFTMFAVQSGPDPIWQFWLNTAIVFFVILLQEIYTQFRHFREFSRLNGRYLCWSYAYDAIVADRTLSDEGKRKQLAQLEKDDVDAIEENGTTTIVRHVGKNILHVVATDTQGNTWAGDAVMESTSVGILTFSYQKLQDNLTPYKRNGIRRIGIFEHPNGGNPSICLFPELSAPNSQARFGRELLMREYVEQ